MNDDFLYRIRTEPPPDFFRRLKRRLEEQARRIAARWSMTRMLLTGFLIGSSTIAAAWWMVGRMPAAEMVPAAEQIASAPQPTQSRLRLRHELEVADAERQPELGGGALGVGPVPPDDRDNTNREPGDAQPARSSIPTGPSTSVTSVPAMPRGQLRIRILAVPTTYDLAKAAIHWSFGGAPNLQPLLEQMPIDSAFDAFCRSTDVPSPDILIASRRIQTAEFDRCYRNGVTNIVESKIGYQAVVLSGSRVMPTLDLTPRQVFLALAKRVPDQFDSTRLVDNPYRTWNDVEWTLDPRRIEVLGPKAGAATRELFVELVMEAGCNSYQWIAALERSDPERHEEICRTLRDDGAYRELAQADVVAAQKRGTEPAALAILDYTDYTKRRDQLDSQLKGTPPSVSTIASGEYAASRPVHLYADKARVDRTPIARLFLERCLSAQMIGPVGILANHGLILDPREWAAQRQRQMVPLTNASN